MTFGSANELFMSSQASSFPMPAVALAPAAFFLGAHMLKCVQEVSEKLKTGDFCKSKPSPRHSTADKGTQTVLSAYKGKTQQSRRAPTRQSGNESSQSVSANEKGKAATRRVSYTTKTTSGGTHEHMTASRTSPNIKQSKSAVAERNRSKTPCSSILQSTKGRTQKGRRVSTGDCEKRTPASCTDSDLSNWLKNPVYASDGESEGRRTDRSDMSPPWLDISMVQKIARQRRSEDASSLSTAIQRATSSRKNKCTSRSRTSLPKMEVVPEKGQEISPRKEPAVVGDVKPPERNLTEMDLTIRRIIEGKMGRRYEELDSKSLKLISKERMKELAAKYAGERPKVNLADRDIPAPSVSRNVPREGKLNDPRAEVAQQRS